MTKQEAINELTRAAELCPTTPLAEACRVLLGEETEERDCPTCKHKDRMPRMYPCCDCVDRYTGDPSMWEPKEVDNG